MYASRSLGYLMMLSGLGPREPSTGKVVERVWDRVWARRAETRLRDAAVAGLEAVVGGPEVGEDARNRR